MVTRAVSRTVGLGKTVLAVLWSLRVVLYFPGGNCT
jgi:hypothetical protein